jgi:hypothetical protein
MKVPAYVTIPAETRVSVRTIDAIDSTQNQVGDRLQAFLEEPLRVDGNETVSRDAVVYGRLAESKESAPSPVAAKEQRSARAQGPK